MSRDYDQVAEQCARERISWKNAISNRLNSYQICAFAEKPRYDHYEVQELFFAKVADKLIAFFPHQAYKLWELIQGYKFVEQFYPRLNAGQLEPIVREILRHNVVVPWLPKEISAKQLYELFF